MGHKIRQIRREQNLTLRDVARMTALTESLLSQIENSKASPSIASLVSISKALNTPMGTFFDFGDRSESPVLRQSKRRLVNTAEGVRYYLLTPDLAHRPFEVLLNEFEPGAATGDRLTHEGTEFGIVLEGKLEVCVGTDVYVLNAGDSITIDSTTPHSLRNLSEKVTTALWVDYPPTF